MVSGWQCSARRRTLHAKARALPIHQIVLTFLLWGGLLGAPISGGVCIKMEGLSNRRGVPGVPGEEIASNGEFRAPNLEWEDSNGKDRSSLRDSSRHGQRLALLKNLRGRFRVVEVFGGGAEHYTRGRVGSPFRDGISPVPSRPVRHCFFPVT